MKIRILSAVGESHPLIEDFHLVDYRGGRLKMAVGDWANNLVGGPFKDEETSRLLNDFSGSLYNGGVIGALLAKKAISSSEETGCALTEIVNHELMRKYTELGIEAPELNRAVTFTGYIGHVIATPEEAVVTAVGDIYVAINGAVVAGITKKIDIHNEALRAKYIMETGDVVRGYNHIRQNIIDQYKFQNIPGHEFSYPALDGTKTLPEEGVEFKIIQNPGHILIWSDGYPNLDGDENIIHDDFTIEGLERKLKQVYEEDPSRYKKYPAVGYLKDDRTAVEVILDDWDCVEFEYVVPLPK